MHIYIYKVYTYFVLFVMPHIYIYIYIYIYVWAHDLPAPWCFLHTTFCTVHKIPRATNT